MDIYNRKTKEYEKNIQSSATVLNFLYNTIPGRIILKLLINPFISKIVGFYHDMPLSKLKIKSFIKNNNIIMEEYEKKEYKNFNDFFTRKRKNKIKKLKEGEFASPADSKLLVYKITKDLKVTIKNSTYTLNELVDNKIDLKDYKNGYCLIFRLAVDDFHRYVFPDSGVVEETYNIKGKLHTVSSISKEYPIYKVNHRIITKLNTKNFDDLIFIEVGALCVGKIINHDIKEYNICDEKGYFKMGGSTIAILIKDKKLLLDKDILDNATKEIEVKLKCGEKIGIKK